MTGFRIFLFFSLISSSERCSYLLFHRRHFFEMCISTTTSTTPFLNFCPCAVDWLHCKCFLPVCSYYYFYWYNIVRAEFCFVLNIIRGRSVCNDEKYESHIHFTYFFNLNNFAKSDFLRKCLFEKMKFENDAKQQKKITNKRAI